jgi:hypothetical protein
MSNNDGVTRRDLIHGTALAGLGSLWPSKALAEAVEAADSAHSYPPRVLGDGAPAGSEWPAGFWSGREG